MFGIGDENKPMNLPRESRRTPPIAALWREGLMEASPLHFKHSLGEGHHRDEMGVVIRRLLSTLDCFHLRQSRFLMISSALYGKGSPQPFIHQPRWRSMRSLIWLSDMEEFWKIREFLSFQIDQMTMMKEAVHIFLKKVPWNGGTHWMYASPRSLGKVHLKSQIAIHHDQICHEKWQWMNRWFEYSGERSQRVQWESFDEMIPKQTSLDLVFSLPSNASHEKTSIYVRDQTFPNSFEGS